MLQQLGPDLYCSDSSFRVGPAFHLPIRMTVVRYDANRLWLHSPTLLSVELRSEIDSLGQVTDLVAPSLGHTSYLTAAKQQYPDARVFGPVGLHEKLPQLAADRELDANFAGWPPDILHLPIEGIPAVRESVFLHAPSRTLIVTDLAFNVQSPTGWFGGLMLRLAGTHRGFACSRLLRSFAKDKNALRASIAKLLRWDFDRLVMAHGSVLEDGAHERFALALERMTA